MLFSWLEWGSGLLEGRPQRYNAILITSHRRHLLWTGRVTVDGDLTARLSQRVSLLYSKGTLSPPFSMPCSLEGLHSVKLTLKLCSTSLSGKYLRILFRFIFMGDFSLIPHLLTYVFNHLFIGEWWPPKAMSTSLSLQSVSVTLLGKRVSVGVIK